MITYFLNENIDYISDSHVYLWDQNISSHRDIHHYKHRMYDLINHQETLLETELYYLAPNTSEDLYADLPQELQEMLKSQLNKLKLPPHLPRQVWINSDEHMLYLEYLQHAPQSILRSIDLNQQQIDKEWSFNHQTMRAISDDGSKIFCTDYPDHQRFIQQELASLSQPPVWKPWPFKKAAFQVGCVYAKNLWWVSLKTNRKHQLIALNQNGQCVHQIGLKFSPDIPFVNKAQNKIALGCGSTEILVVEMNEVQGIQIQKLTYPLPRLRDNALKCKLSPDGNYLAVRGSLDQKLSVLDLEDQSSVFQTDLKIHETNLSDGTYLLKQPDFLLLNQSLITLSNGLVQTHPLI